MMAWCWVIILCTLFTKGSFSPTNLLEPDKLNHENLPPLMTLSEVMAPVNKLRVQDQQDECPTDSNLINGKCECLPCNASEICNNAEVILPKTPPIPGSCCSGIKCVQKTCDVDGTQRLHNTTWIQNCQTCKCYNGLKFCKTIEGCGNENVAVTESIDDEILMEQRKIPDKTCLTDSGVVYLHGAKWSSDLCTNCTCEDGEIKCIAHYCEHNQNTYCEPLTTCNLECQYGYRVSTQSSCEVCECALNPLLLNITKQKHISTDHVYTIIELYNFIELKNNFDNPDDVFIHSKRNETSSHLSVFLIITLVVLTIICGALFWRLIRSNKLRNTKMDLSKTPDLRNYIPVSN